MNNDIVNVEDIVTEENNYTYGEIRKTNPVSLSIYD